MRTWFFVQVGRISLIPQPVSVSMPPSASALLCSWRVHGLAGQRRPLDTIEFWEYTRQPLTYKRERRAARETLAIQAQQGAWGVNDTALSALVSGTSTDNERMFQEEESRG